MKINIDVNSAKFSFELARVCSPYVAIVYAALLELSENGVAIISCSKIGEFTNIPTRSIPRIIKRLEEMKLITTQHDNGSSTRYYVKDIFTENEREEEQPEVRAAEEEPARRSEEQPADNDIYFGDFNVVHMSKSEYQKLCQKYNQKVVDKIIEEMDTWCGKNNSNRYDNYAAAVKSWIIKDERNVAEINQRKGKKIAQTATEQAEADNDTKKYLDLIN